MKSVKLFIADEETMFSVGLESYFSTEMQLNKEHPYSVVGTASDLLMLKKGMRKTNPDILIIDIKLGEDNMLDHIVDIKAEFSNLLIVVVTSYEQTKFVKAAFISGVDAYLLKKNNPELLFSAFSAILKNETFMGTDVHLTPPKKQYNNGTSHWDQDDTFLVKFKLTNRELEVLKGIAHGKSNKKIAAELFISDQTVSVHRKNIMRKLNVSNTASLIKYAYDHNLL